MHLKLLVVAVTALCALANSSSTSAQQGDARKYYVEGKRIPAPAMAPPVYPDREHRRRIGGTTTVAFSYNAQGKVLTADVKTSSGNKNLDNAALAAVRQWTIQPVVASGAAGAGSSETSLTFTP